MSSPLHDDREFSSEVEIHTSQALEWLGGFKAKVAYQRKWKMLRAQRLAETLTTASGMTLDEIRSRVDQGDEVAELIETTAGRATENGNREYSDLLARLVAAALIDDAKIDPIAYLIDRIVKLQPIHIRILALFADDEWHKSYEIESTNDGYKRIDTDLVANELSMPKGILEACLRDLAEVYFTEVKAMSQPRFEVKDLGRAAADEIWRVRNQLGGQP